MIRAMYENSVCTWKELVFSKGILDTGKVVLSAAILPWSLPPQQPYFLSESSPR
jgi:hypothetical protein